MDQGESPTATATEPRSLGAFADLLRPMRPSLSETQIEKLALYRDMLRARNQVVNLTAVRDFDGIERRLILESLRLDETLEKLVDRDNGRIMDLGSGGGIPGMILAICHPEHEFVLLDATGKKVAFLQECVSELGLSNASAVQGRAEELGHEMDWRASFDLVTARAVTSLSALMELSLPFLRRGCWLLLPKGADIDEEMAIARRAAGKLSATIAEASFLPSVGSSVDTRLVLVRKDGPTPAGYPRRVGLPAKSPLGSEQDRPDKRVRRGTR